MTSTNLSAKATVKGDCKTEWRLLAACMLLTGLLALQACSFPYNIYTDHREISTQIDDKTIATDIKTRLMGERLPEGWELSVYCFRGRVYLVGEIPEESRAWAVQLAQKVDGVEEVIPHWFASPASSGDTMAELKLSANLLSTPNLNSTQISMEIHGGEAVLLGIVSDQGVVNRAVRIAQNTPGILKVTSYLIY